MVRNVDVRSVSLLELLRRARVAEQARRGEAVSPSSDRPVESQAIIDRRDERGSPYPGDFPNDLSRYYRGCF